MTDEVKAKLATLTTDQLIDTHGRLTIQQSEAEELRKLIGAELIQRNAFANGKPCTNAFEASMVKGGVAWRLNREAIVLDMGQAWADQHSTQSLRSPYVVTKPSKKAALAALADAAD